MQKKKKGLLLLIRESSLNMFFFPVEHKMWFSEYYPEKIKNI